AWWTWAELPAERPQDLAGGLRAELIAPAAGPLELPVQERPLRPGNVEALRRSDGPEAQPPQALLGRTRGRARQPRSGDPRVERGRRDAPGAFVDGGEPFAQADPCRDQAMLGLLAGVPSGSRPAH